jgi:hypothetical protein
LHQVKTEIAPLASAFGLPAEVLFHAELVMSSGGFFGPGDMGPSGRYGAWPGCGCSSLFIILAGILLVCGGGLRFLGF